MIIGILRRLFNMEDKPKESNSLYPRIYCFWAADGEQVSRADARVLYDAFNLVCRSCKGCQ